MTAAKDTQMAGAEQDLDPEVAAFLRECDEQSPDVSADELDALLSSVEMQVHQSESGAGGWLKSRSTTTRRGLALGSFALLVGLAAFAMGTGGVSGLPTWAVAVCLGSLGVLVALSLWVALRPLQAPALSTGQVAGVVLVALACAGVVSFVPEAAQAGAGAVASSMASPCMYMGLLVGLPIYALARLLDRGSRLSSVLAACAGGLAANFVLDMHCPVHTPEHMLLGHASVLVLFVAGAFAVRAVESRITRRG